MKDDVTIKKGISIPFYEIEITTSRAGGTGGQHVNKTDSRVSIRWNVLTTRALTEEQKTRVYQNLQSRLTGNGEIIIHNSETRSQIQNKEAALAQLTQEISKALHVPKKRMKSRISRAVKASRMRDKKHRSDIKKIRVKSPFSD